jgi:chemotaxis protein CheZ
MSQSTPPYSLLPAEYIAIENAILQSDKGRGFLSDYLQRNRAAETHLLLRAIAKLQHAMNGMEGQQHLNAIYRDLTEIKRNMARTRCELASLLTPDQGGNAAPEARAAKLDAAFAYVEAEVLAILDMWDFETSHEDAEVQEPVPPALESALRNGLIEELSFAMLSDSQKAALFN